MAITRSTAAARAERVIITESWLEAAALLLLSSGLVVFGLFLAYKAKANDFQEVDDRLKSNQIVNLNTVTSADDLVPFMGVLSEADERQFAAKKVYDYLLGAGSGSASRRSISNIYELGRIRVEEKEIGPRRGLGVFKERLAEERRRLGEDAARTGRQIPESVSVPLLTRRQLNELKPSFVMREPSSFRNQFLFYAALYFICFYLVFIVWRARGLKGDTLILPVIHVLTGIGLMAMISLRDPVRDAPIFSDFAQGVVGGAILMMIAGMIDYQASALRKLSFIPLIAAFAMSAALVVFGSGPAGSDAKVNLLGFQPAEIIKILIVLFLAGYFASNWEFLRDLSARPVFKSLRWLNLPRLQYLLPLLIAMAVVLGFFFFQRDLGPALVLASSFLALYGVARRRFALVAIALCSLIAVFYVSYTYSFPETVAGRIRMWVSPWDNLVRGGEQLAHSLWALSTGGVSGMGIGLGEPGYIPAGHTDLIASTIGEELGLAGLLAVFALYGVLIHRSLRVALRAQGDYSMFLGLGLTLIVATEIILIGGGTTGMLPLSGVVMPFLSYGKTSMIANFAIFGMIMSISARKAARQQSEPFRKPVRWVGLALLVLGAAVMVKAAHAQIIKADDFAISGSLTIQADNRVRYVYNPRIIEIIREIPRGSILDRNGIPIATSNWDLLEKNRRVYESLGINIDVSCSRSDSRHYPFAKTEFGGSLYHIVGDARYQLNWAAKNTSFFVERDYKTQLQGFDDKAERVEMLDQRTGRKITPIKYDYRELIPVLRSRYNKDSEGVKNVLNRNNDVQLTIDVRFQLEVARILKKKITEAKVERGVIVVLDPKTGDLLAAASYPWPADIAAVAAAMDDQDKENDQGDVLYDRARWGVYPPGSTFKILTAVAGMQKNVGLDQVFTCSAGGTVIKGWGRPIMDDEGEFHGAIGMRDAIVYSCNAYFAQLGARIKADALVETSKMFEIEYADNTPVKEVRDLLPWASFGQAPVLATPFQMARVAATIANGGKMPDGRWVADDSNKRTKGPKNILSGEQARAIGEAMRGAVMEGTGKKLRGAVVSVAGKTGTAEVTGKKSHSWFIGYAPFDPNARKQIAFAVIIENAGYGGEFAVPATGEVVQAAVGAKVLQ